MLDQLAQADVVFLGETHDDETTHRLELAVYEGLLQRKPKQVVLAMEMFERDVQPGAGRLSGRPHRRAAIPCAEPSLGELPHGLSTADRVGQADAGCGDRVEFPAPLRAQVSMNGADALKTLKPEQAGHVPRQFLPNTDAYWRRVDNAIRGHQDMMRGGTDANCATLLSAVAVGQRDGRSMC